MLKKKLKQSLKLQIMAFVLIAVVVSGLISGVMIVSNQYMLLEEFLVNRGKRMASYIAGISQDYLITKDYIQLDNLISEINNDPEVVYALIKDSKGKIVTSLFASLNFKQPEVKALMGSLPKTSGLAEILTAIKNKGIIREADFPILFGKEYSGSVVIGLSDSKIEQQTVKSMYFMGFAYLLAFAVVYFLMARFHKIITKPVLDLAALMALVSWNRNYNLRAPVERSDELGELARGFNAMLEQINVRDVELQAYRKHLEQEVDRRTAELVNLNKHLQDQLIEINKMQEVVTKSELRFQQVAVCAGEFIWEVDANGLYTYASPVLETILGYKSEEVVGKKHFYDLFVPESKDMLKEGALLCFLRKEVIRDFVNANLHKNGSIVYLETNGMPILDDNGNLLGYRGSDEDITERKFAQEAILTAQHKYADLVNNLNVGVYRNTPGPQGRFLEANPAIIAMFEADSKEEFVSHNDSDLYFNPEKRAEFSNKMLEHGFVNNEELQLKTLKGKEFWASLTAVAKKDISGNIYFDGIIENITERKRSEQELQDAYAKLSLAHKELVQSEKLAALGRFSYGIAHEVKNPLGIILGGAEYLQTQLKDSGEEVKMILDKIKESTLRADSILRGLLKFSKPSELKIEKVSVSVLVNDSLSLIKYRLPLNNIDIEILPGGDNLLVEVDRNQLQQVIFNVLINAAESMPSGGRIVIKPYMGIAPRFSFEKEVGVIEIVDTGIGITKEDMSKMFEPFFTTKRDVKGTGLGLSVSKNIVKSNRGDIFLDSELGKGTQVTIILPLAA